MASMRKTYGTGAKRVFYATAQKQDQAPDRGMHGVMAAHAKAGTFKKKSKGR